MKLNNCEIWESSNCLYIKTPKDIMLKLTGESVNKVKMVVESLALKKTLSDDIAIVESEIKEVLMLLTKLGIIQQDKKENSIYSKIGIYSDTSILKAIKVQMPCFDIELIENANNIKDYSLLVIVSPFYPDPLTMSEIGYKSYQEKIPLLYCEFSAMSFTIGPLVLPKQHSPSLNCYLKRRMVNAKSPKLFAEMITQPSKPLLKSKFEDYYYHDLYLTLLCEEISKFLKFEGSYSKHLVGMSITTDFVTYEIEKTRVLKDPFSKLFVKTPFVPFNG